MAGVAGFEPTNDGSKFRCLASLATPQHKAVDIIAFICVQVKSKILLKNKFLTYIMP